MSFTLDHHLYGPSPYRKARPASLSSSSGFHSQRRRPAYSHQPQSSADSLDTFNGDMARRNEKEILQALNDRFAGYIDKVRNLELLNRNLEAEAEHLRQSQAGRASVGEHYDRELGDLRGLVQELTGEKARAALEHEHLEEDIQHVRARLEDEARNREEMEAAARAMNKYVDECGLARLELDKKLCALQEEVSFLKKNHEEEVADLLAQIQGAQVSFEARDTVKADVTSALREIRAQLDGHASKSATQAEEWFNVRMEHLSVAARGNTDAIRGAQEEIAEYRRQLQNRTIELETLRGTKESLERQCLENEDRHQGDISSLQETIHQLDNDLKSTKWEMASQLRNYQELLNVKMALDIEIAAYRKLLEGEETRFISGAGPYSYLKLKAEELSDTVIVEEQTDETQVTEVTEDAEEEEEEEEEEGEKDEKGGDEEEGDDTKADAEEGEGEEEEGDKKEEEDGEGAEEEKGGEEDEGKEGGEEEEEEKSKSPEKAASPPPKSPAKTPQPKSPKSKSPESKSPPAKSPAKSPAVKSPTESKSPEAKSPVTKDAPAEEKKEEKKSEATKEEKKQEKPEPAKEEKKEKPESAKEEKKEKDKPEPAKEEKKEKEKPEPVKEEKKQEPKEKEKPETKAEEKSEKPDAKKESKAEETPKKADTPKPAPAAKPAPESTPKESPAPAKKEDEKATPPKAEDKPKAEEKPEKTESKKDEKKTEEKEMAKAADSKEAKEGGKTDKKKPSGTEAKVSKEEKAKK